MELKIYICLLGSIPFIICEYSNNTNSHISSINETYKIDKIFCTGTGLIETINMSKLYVINNSCRTITLYYRK